jgi:hypothetical protein
MEMNILKLKSENQRQDELVSKIQAMNLTAQKLVNYLFENKIAIVTDPDYNRIKTLVEFMVMHGVFFPNAGCRDREQHIRRIRGDNVFIIDKVRTLRNITLKNFEKYETNSNMRVGFQTLSFPNFVNLNYDEIMEFYKKS